MILGVVTGSSLTSGPARLNDPNAGGAMSLPRIVTREEWLAARKELLAEEKHLTRQRDALNIERRNLPMVEIEKDYVFDGPNRGHATMAT
jgi:predicted dithiol-disulfide oxidoreductase (DUF899 family)